MLKANFIEGSIRPLNETERQQDLKGNSFGQVTMMIQPNNFILFYS